MSRYIKHFERDGIPFVLSYGYDEPLSEYFIGVENYHLQDEDDSYWFLISNYFTLVPFNEGKFKDKYTFTNSELLDVIAHYELEQYMDKHHIKQLTLDLPF